MELLHVDGQSIKFVDRKLWKRDSVDGKNSNLEEKINFIEKVFMLTKRCDQEGKSGSHKIARKCPIEIEYPKKRRILKRPKRFKTYFTDRKPFSIPSFSFPRCLIRSQKMNVNERARDDNQLLNENQFTSHKFG